MLLLEKTLGLDQITPMQTSYTQTAEDRAAEGNGSNKSKDDSKSGIEPSEEDESNGSDDE